MTTREYRPSYSEGAKDNHFEITGVREGHPEQLRADAAHEPARALSPTLDAHTTDRRSVSLDAADLYLSKLSSERLLTRDDEIDLGRRIEAGERALAEAWVRWPAALIELGELADEIRLGSITIDEPPASAVDDDSPKETAEERLARLLDLARSIALAQQAGTDVAADLSKLVDGLVELRPGSGFADRVERALRDALEQAKGRQRDELKSALAAAGSARRAAMKAKTELVRANLRLVVSLARRFLNRGIPLLDLVQEGNLGLMRAADKFDHRMGNRFSTYAAWWIKQAFDRAVLYQGKVIRMPAHLGHARRRVLEARRTLAQEGAREPSVEEIAEQSGLPLDKVKAIRGLSMDALSLDAPVGEDGDASYGDFLTGDEPAPDEAVAEHRLLEQAREALATMTPREREVLRLRFGLDGEEEHTLQEIGDTFSLSRERVRQIEAQALQKLRLRTRAAEPQR